MSDRYPTTVTLADGTRLDAAESDDQRALLRLLAQSRSDFGDVVDLDTVRPVIMPSRFVVSGTWILRIDALIRTLDAFRRRAEYGTSEYESLVPRVKFMFFSSDDGLVDFERSWTEPRLLVPQTIAHYARQVLGPKTIKP